MKYTIEELRKFLDPETRLHMSAHVIQTEAVEMIRQLVGMLDTKVEINEKTEYRKLWHDRIDQFVNMFEGHNEVKVKMVLSNFVMGIIERHLQFFYNKQNEKLNEFKEKLKAKFDKGMEEHGMEFEKVDFDAEIENEVLDICNYLIGKKYSKNDGN